MRATVFPVVGRLRFADDLEPSFTRHRLEQSLPLARFAPILALLLYALFGIFDFFTVPVGARWIWVIRYVIFCPVALAVFGLTFTRWFRPVMQPLLAGVAGLAGLGIVAMIAIAHPRAGYLYYAGLLLVIPWAYTLLQLRFSYATWACLAIIAGYEIVAVLLQPTPIQILINNNFFFLSAVIIGMVAGYTIERGLRTDFLQTLTFDVVDDGKGFDAQGRGLGAGFRNMADRLGALGGRLKVESAPRRGTTVSGAIPAGAGADAG